MVSDNNNFEIEISWRKKCAINGEKQMEHIARTAFLLMQNFDFTWNCTWAAAFIEFSAGEKRLSKQSMLLFWNYWANWDVPSPNFKYRTYWFNVNFIESKRQNCFQRPSEWELTTENKSILVFENRRKFSLKLWHISKNLFLYSKLLILLQLANWHWVDLANLMNRMDFIHAPRLYAYSWQICCGTPKGITGPKSLGFRF